MLTFDELMSQAYALDESGQIHDALRLWREAAARSADPEIHAMCGRACLRGGLTTEGEQQLRATIAAAPKHPDAWFFLGFHYEHSGQLEEARQLLEQGLALRPWGPAHVVLGEVYRSLGLVEVSRASFERALECDELDSEAWYGLGLLSQVENPAVAVDMFRKAISTDPQMSSAHRELGLSLLRLGNSADAEREIRTALALGDNSAWAPNYLGQALMIRDDFEGAEAAFRRSIQIWPDPPLFYCNLGDGLASQGRMKEAEESYRTALTLDTSDGLANLRYGQILADSGRPSRARKYLLRAEKVESTRVRALEALSNLAGPPSKA